MAIDSVAKPRERERGGGGRRDKRKRHREIGREREDGKGNVMYLDGHRSPADRPAWPVMDVYDRS